MDSAASAAAAELDEFWLKYDQHKALKKKLRVLYAADAYNAALSNLHFCYSCCKSMTDDNFQAGKMCCDMVWFWDDYDSDSDSDSENE